MMLNDPLKACLLDLLCALKPASIPLMLGGGYGLYLKQIHLAEAGTQTLLPLDTWPAPRATNDLDVFLQAEVVTDSARMGIMASVLSELGFVAIESHKFMQFERAVDEHRRVKVDLLVGPLGARADRSTVIIQDWRVKPVPSVSLHARRTDEAVAIEENPLTIELHGARSTGEPCAATVLIPQAFPYLMMKLVAFRDWEEAKRPGSDKARVHAADLYRTVAMMTEPEYEAAKTLRNEHRENDHVAAASRIVGQHFDTATSLGVIRLREHGHFVPTMDVSRFVAVLAELLGQ